LCSISEAYARLNTEQRVVFERIVASVNDDCRGVEMKNRVFLVHGIAGCGKTTTYNAIHDYLMAQGKQVACVAYTGMAAALLPGGKTLHSAFGLPVPLTKDSVSRLQPFMQQ
jgi:signal recognition particle GTPase